MTLARIRSTLLAATVAAATLAAPAARALDVQFGYIDSARIFREYKEAQEAQARFDRRVQGWRDEAAEKEKAVQTLQAEVRDQGPILSSLKRQEKEETLQRAIADYERFVQEVWGPNGRAAVENEQVTGEVVGRIRTSVEKLAAERGLNLVLDAASGFLIYADKQFDLTTEVVNDLNAGAIVPGGSQE